MCVVVVVILITLLNNASVTICEVVLYIVLICKLVAALISLCKLVDIEPVVTTKKVLDGAVVLCAIYASVNSRNNAVV